MGKTEVYRPCLRRQRENSSQNYPNCLGSPDSCPAWPANRGSPRTYCFGIGISREGFCPRNGRFGGEMRRNAQNGRLDCFQLGRKSPPATLLPYSRPKTTHLPAIYPPRCINAGREWRLTTRRSETGASNRAARRNQAPPEGSNVAIGWAAWPMPEFGQYAGPVRIGAVPGDRAPFDLRPGAPCPARQSASVDRPS